MCVHPVWPSCGGLAERPVQSPLGETEAVAAASSLPLTSPRHQGQPAALISRLCYPIPPTHEP